MLADITPAQFNEWVALDRLEPWGDDWVQTARLEAAYINHSASPPETPVCSADLVPTAENRAKHSEEHTDATIAQRVKAAFGG